MKIFIKYIIFILLITISSKSFAQQHLLSEPTDCRFARGPVVTNARKCPACAKDKDKDEEARKEEDRKRELAKPKYGALSIDRKNGFYYGWAYDYATLAEAEQRAVAECAKRGGNCTVVLSFSGEGCAAYRTINGNVGTAFGWGVAATKAEADAIAIKECRDRSKEIYPSNYVWACNSKTTAPLKEIYNASGEIGEIPYKGPHPGTHAVVFSKDGKKMATGGIKIRIWSLPAYKLVREIESKDKYGRPAAVEALSFSPDGKTLVSGEKNQVKLWEVSSGNLIKKLGEHQYEIPSVNFSPDGKYIASAGVFSADDARIWNAETGALVKVIKEHEFGLDGVEFSPDSKTLATISVDGTAKLWNVGSWSLQQVLNEGNKDHLIDGRFSPDGRTFATISFDEPFHVRVWDTNSGRRLLDLPGHNGYIGYAVAYINNNILISAGYDDTLITWDLSTGRRLSTVEDAEFWHLEVSQDGTVATAGAGGVTIWKVDDSGTIRRVVKL